MKVEAELVDLRDRLLARTKQLESLEEFRLNKEQLEDKQATLELTLSQERALHQEQVCSRWRNIRCVVEGELSGV